MGAAGRGGDCTTAVAATAPELLLFTFAWHRFERQVVFAKRLIPLVESEHGERPGHFFALAVKGPAGVVALKGRRLIPELVVAFLAHLFLGRDIEKLVAQFSRDGRRQDLVCATAPSGNTVDSVQRIGDGLAEAGLRGEIG